MKILVVSSQAFSLCQFRADMMKDFINAGHTVYAAAPDNEQEWAEKLYKIGVTYSSFYLERNGVNPLKDIKGYLSIRKIIKEIKPDLLFSYQAKTVIYGSLAAKSLGIKNIYALIAGLGSVFRGSNKGWKRQLVKVILGLQYKVALWCPKTVFFQNHDDSEKFTRNRLVSRKKVEFMNGSGVNLEHFKYTPMPEEKRFLFVGRLIGDKGIIEYLEAAKKVKEQHPEAIFDVVGYYDTNPTALSPEDLNKYFDIGIANYLGKQDDVYPYLASSYCFILPSYHEGTPKSVLEALAVGRPVITTDAPGCRETVVDGENGYLVSVADSDDLAKRITELIENETAAARMAKKSHELAAIKYDVRLVNKSLIEKMGL